MIVNSALTPSPSLRHLPEPRLVKAAHEFEAQLMKELLAPMTRAAGLEDDSDLCSGGSLADFAGEALAQGISLRGGVGIADSVIRHLSHNDPGVRPVSPSGTSQPHFSPTLRTTLK